MSTSLQVTPAPAKRRKRGNDSQSLLSSVPWIGPALLLILAMVVYPAGYMIYNSTRKISSVGTDLHSVGLDNFVTVFQDPALPRIMINTVVWVLSVVVITVLLSLALAQFLNKPFPGRTFVRMAVIVPWAASVVMTTTVFYYGLDPNYGIFNKFFIDIGLMDEGFGWTKNAVPAMLVSIVVAIFVSIPFTTYTLLAGMQAIPEETLEAARVDGAGKWKTYIFVILPQLRSALAVAALINIINVFNNLPILKVMTGSIPGNSADTLMTYIFKVLQFDRRLDISSALSVVNFAIVVVIVAIYVKSVKPMQEV
ncbi:sugar ABC transporter permease [Arthrobacter sp. MYb211]|uniref:carbohydrate ABC transporter permease n=1 Tax=Micrococcaceae TaxID=1268 RepID=UPI000CFDC9AA|nr:MULTISPECIES: sugar ABC transporter permease [unclassified Arthrobacter]PRA02415.1 sugar ABC transporter permease [Arthrobacter sp. MYb229]PRA13396.1 sugar ABC transporter permease [Arthrobacter sp. MYb221]PRB50642.1 sugar ABC transporter permease [Arthrobacter sp. MYb216]PRC10593.1 sugar ABC transporter permease [Arthrobacter sp. MYb211]